MSGIVFETQPEHLPEHIKTSFVRSNFIVLLYFIRVNVNVSGSKLYIYNRRSDYLQPNDDLFTTVFHFGTFPVFSYFAFFAHK